MASPEMPTAWQRGPIKPRALFLFPDNSGPWETCPREPLEGGRVAAPPGITRQQHQEEDGSIEMPRAVQPKVQLGRSSAQCSTARQGQPLTDATPTPKALGQLSPVSNSFSLSSAPKSQRKRHRCLRALKPSPKCSKQAHHWARSEQLNALSVLTRESVSSLPPFLPYHLSK